MRLLQNDKSKQVDVHRDYDPYDQPTTPDYNYEGEPSLSQIDDSDTQKMTVITDEHMEWVQKIYGRQPPRRSDFTTNQLLARIADLLAQQRQVDVPSDFTHPRAKTFTDASVSEWVLEGITQYGYLYIPPVPVNVDVWLGYSSGQYLTSLITGQYLNARIPHIDVITLTFTYGGTPFTLYAYPSTRPFSLDVGGI